MLSLTSDMIFDLPTHLWPFQIWLKCQFSHRTVNHKKIWNAPLDAQMCPLQIINWHPTLSLTLHGVNTCFIHHPSNFENYSVRKSEAGQPTNMVSGEHIYIFLQIRSSKFKTAHCYRKLATISTCGKLALNNPENGQVVIYSKIQNRLSRAP